MRSAAGTFRRVCGLLQHTSRNQYVLMQPRVFPEKYVLSAHQTQVMQCLCTAASKNAVTPEVEKKRSLMEWYHEKKQKYGFLKYSKSTYRCVAVLLYDSVDSLDIDLFFKEFKMDDTFFSWFLIMELHLWMLAVRCNAEEKEGQVIMRCLVEVMWNDVADRASVLKEGVAKTLKDSLFDMHEEFTAALLAYDEGLQTSDYVLANVVWSRFLKRQCDDPRTVEFLVEYIRRQLQHLDTLSRDDFVEHQKVSWLPLKER